MQLLHRMTAAEVVSGHASKPVGLPPSRWKAFALGIPLPVLCGVIWWAASQGNWFGGHVLPTPEQVWVAYRAWIFAPSTGLDPFNGTWLQSVTASVVRVLVGFLVASVLGIGLGVVLGRMRTLEAMMDPLIQALRPVPVTAWVPFSLIIFGLSRVSAIGLVTIAAFFPIVINTATGCRHVPEPLLRAARTLGASEFESLRTVVIPYAVPTILAGLRLGLGMSWVALIVAEMVGVKSGLGYVLWQSYYWNRTDMLIATIVTIGGLGYLSDRVMVAYSRRKLFWHGKKA
jgi:NitT/TauT family transport system permease protein